MFQLGMLVGTLLSPYIFDAIDYYGCYGLAIALNAIVLTYFIFLIKELPKPKNQNCQMCHHPHTSNTACHALLLTGEGSNNQLWTVNGEKADAGASVIEDKANNKNIVLHAVGSSKFYVQFQAHCINILE